MKNIVCLFLSSFHSLSSSILLSSSRFAVRTLLIQNSFYTSVENFFIENIANGNTCKICYLYIIQLTYYVTLKTFFEGHSEPCKVREGINVSVAALKIQNKNTQLACGQNAIKNI